MACDLRIAASSARLSDWHLRRTGLGIGAWGAAARLSRLVGVDKAKEVLLLGEEISGAEAERIGLVNKSVREDDLTSAALQWAGSIASRPRRGVRATLGYLQLQAGMSRQEALRWAQLTPEYMGLELRPFRDAAQRFMESASRTAASTSPGRKVPAKGRSSGHELPDQRCHREGLLAPDPPVLEGCWSGPVALPRRCQAGAACGSRISRPGSSPVSRPSA